MLSDSMNQMHMFDPNLEPVTAKSIIDVEMTENRGVVKVDLMEARPQKPTREQVVAHGLVDKHEWAKWTLKSAFHKEVRRSDQHRGNQYVYWFNRNLGDKTLRYYCRNILFEECRNIELMDFMNRADSTQIMEMARRLLRSRKKGELAVRKGCFEEYVRAFCSANDMEEDEQKMSPSEVIDVMRNGDLFDRFKVFWRVELGDVKESRDELDVQLKILGREVGEWPAKLVESPWTPYSGGFYPRKILIEMISGHWDEECNELAPAIDVEQPFVPMFEDYVYDNHTWHGKRWLRTELVQIAPGVPKPGRADVRWSGLLRGVYWREVACRKFSDPLDVKWEDMELDKNVWQNLIRLDAWFYEKLYEEIGMDEYGRMLT